MTRQQRVGLAVFAVALLLAISLVQRPMDYLRYDPQSNSGLYSESIMRAGAKRETSLILDMSLQFFGAAAMGMREAVASLLWVRSDEFFHSGQYEPILPLVRLVTWLDPHQIDVYTTGAWHLDYNFTDTDQRSDRRYIPPAIKLMEEGINNNPDIFDLYFDLAWTHYYQKIKDYNKAAEWMKKATTKPARDPNTGQIMPRPAFVDRMLAHAYEKTGRLDLAEKQWRKAMAQTEQDFIKHNRDGSVGQELVVCKKNLGLLLLRRAWRNGDMDAYARGLEVLSTIDEMDQEQKRAYEAAKKSFAELKAAGKSPHDTQPPVDAGFHITWKKVKPKVLSLEGTLRLVPAEYYKGLASEPYTLWYQTNEKAPPEQKAKWRDGCRLRVILCDYDYDWWQLREQEQFEWEVDNNQTIMMDEVSVRNGDFQLTIDMSQDPRMYPFSKDKYKLIVWFNPQEAPDFVQDRIGWKGEGMTNENCIDTATIPGHRMIRKEFTLQKNDII